MESIAHQPAFCCRGRGADQRNCRSSARKAAMRGTRGTVKNQKIRRLPSSGMYSVPSWKSGSPKWSYPASGIVRRRTPSTPSLEVIPQVFRDGDPPDGPLLREEPVVPIVCRALALVRPVVLPFVGEVPKIGVFGPRQPPSERRTSLARRSSRLSHPRALRDALEARRRGGPRDPALCPLGCFSRFPTGCRSRSARCRPSDDAGHPRSLPPAVPVRRPVPCR